MTVSECHAPSILRAPTRLVALPILSIVLAFGCGNNGESGTNGDGNGSGATNGAGATNGSGATGGGGSSELGPVYALGATVSSPEGPNPFVLFADDLSEDRLLRLDEALEVTGFGVYSSPVLGGGVFFTQASGGILQRWHFLEDGSLEPDGRISFAGLGLTQLSGRASHMQFVSPEKAYLFDTAFARVIVWNPRTLEIVRPVDIPGIELSEDVQFILSNSVVRRNDELVFTSSYRTQDNDRVFRRGDLIVIDVATDEISVDSTTSCGDLGSGVLTTNGDIVWASGNFTAGWYPVIPELAFEPCMITARSGSVEFDESSVSSLTALADGAPAGTLIPAGQDRALLSVYDEESFPIPDDATVSLGRVQAWRWWEIDLRNMTANLLPDSEYNFGATISYEVGEDTYLLTLSDDFSTSTLNRVQREVGAGPIPGISAVGILSNGVVLLRGPDPGPRMAQLFEPFGGRSVRSF